MDRLSLLRGLISLEGQGALLFRTYHGYWGLHLKAPHIELRYWWPIRPVGLDASDVRSILVTIEFYRTRGSDAERPSIAVETTHGWVFHSVHVLEPQQLRSAADALAACTGVPVLPVRKKGVFSRSD